MKKIFVLIVVVFLSLMMFSTAKEDVSIEIITDAGVTPQSPFYGIDIALDKISLALTRDHTKRVVKGLEIAQERLLEVQEMLRDGKNEEAAEAVEAHGEVMTEIETDIEVYSAENSEEELETELSIEDEVDAHQERVQDIRITIKGNISDEAVDALVETILADLEWQTASVEVHIKQKKGETKIRIEQEGTDAEALEEELEEEHGFGSNAELRARKDLEHAEDQMLKAQEKIDSESEKGSDVSLSMALLAEAQEAYAQALVAFEAGDFDAVEDFAEDAWDAANEARKGKNFEKQDESEADNNEEEYEELENDDEDSFEEENESEEDSLDEEDDSEQEEDLEDEEEEEEMESGY